MRLNGLMPLGREDVKLQWQVAPLGTAFTASSGVISGTTSWTDTLPSGLTFIQEVSGLTSDTPYHWRVRLLYHHNRLGQTASRWIHIPWNGWNEQDFRASAYTRRTITYTYDPLYRLTHADYSDGKDFRYQYDAVGNRTRYTETITSTNIITYSYDAANRLTNVDGVAYTWDNNGNLLSDGSKTYTYTQANRLIAVSDQQSAVSFVYNGDGARVKQVIDGEAITYTLDLAAPLVTVLAERSGATTTHYVYALGTRPLAQHEGVWAYLLPDALGSVRQLVDADGNVTLAQTYQPYGSLLERAGSGTSTFGYAGEQADESGLMYLRARYYSSGLGVFLSRDMWAGDERHPATLHGFLYVEGNPINFADPSGLFSDIPFSLFTECCYNSAPTPEARLQQIIEETNHNGAEALFKAFEDKCLLDKFGRVAGQTCGERLAWLLRATRSSPLPFFPAHSSIWFGNDSGFAEEFRDDQFYNGEIWWKKPQNDQVGHFLTAVDMFFYGYPSASEAAIGHELLADPGPGLWPPPGWRFGEQVRATQQWHLDAWSRALDYVLTDSA